MNPEIIKSFKLGAVFKDCDTRAVGVSFSRDGKNLGVGYEDGTVLCIDPDTAVVRKSHKSHKYGLSLFGFMNGDASGSSAYAVANPRVTYDFSIRVWDLNHNRFNRVFKSHEAAVLSISSHPYRDIIASSASDGWSYLWDIREEKPVWQHMGSKNGLAVFPAGIDIVAPSSGSVLPPSIYLSSPMTKSISIYELSNMQVPVETFSNILCAMDEIVVTPNQNWILIGSHDQGTVTCIDANTGVTSSVISTVPSPDGFRLRVSPCSRYLLVCNPKINSVDIYDLESASGVHSLVGHGGFPMGAFSPTQTLIATVSMPIGLWVPLD